MIRLALKFSFACALTLGLVFALPAFAQGAAPSVRLSDLKPMELRPQDRLDIARIEAYFNNFQTLKARFQQFDPQGQLTQGTVYLRRPGNMRFAYDKPSPILIVADGTFVIFHDASVRQIDRVPINSTPLGILLDERIRLTDSRLRIAAIDRAGQQLRVTVYDQSRPREGAITLNFTDNPLAFRGWTVHDAAGLSTTIAITGVETGLDLPAHLFTFIDPPLPAARDAR